MGRAAQNTWPPLTHGPRSSDALETRSLGRATTGPRRGWVSHYTLTFTSHDDRPEEIRPSLYRGEGEPRGPKKSHSQWWVEAGSEPRSARLRGATSPPTRDVTDLAWPDHPSLGSSGALVQDPHSLSERWLEGHHRCRGHLKSPPASPWLLAVLETAAAGPRGEGGWPFPSWPPLGAPLPSGTRSGCSTGPPLSPGFESSGQPAAQPPTSSGGACCPQLSTWRGLP